MALLWASFSALVHVATSEGQPYDIFVTIGGFIAFVIGASWFAESMKRDLIDRLRSSSTGSQS